eukprot:CAMPEP_0172455488 /NCGR_PEP_ID=MMETSP1065-20121228/12089_1 /TAXON_ID=265537 /ORGANISM="Amphiprora paludosa, Strain CCMP125" /LENGTH=626 /DNA_ID=CAMNT_0013207949 /DNA_START=111 /DNA_END=1991 /DNA_ORIENTATION=+
MNSTEPISPRRTASSSSSVQPEEFLPLNKMDGNGSESSILDSIRMKLEAANGESSSNEVNKRLDSIRARLGTSDVGDSSHQDKVQRHDHDAMSSSDSCSQSFVSNNSRWNDGGNSLRPTDFMRAQDTDRSPRKTVPGGFVPYTKETRKPRQRRVEDDGMPLAALAIDRDTTPSKPSKRVERTKFNSQEEELELEELKSHARTAKTEPMHESESSITMACQFSLTGSSIAFGNSSLSNFNSSFENSGITNMEDSFQSLTDSPRRQTNSSPMRKSANASGSSKMSALLASPDISERTTLTPRQSGSSSARRRHSGKTAAAAASLMSSVAPPPLANEEEEEEESTVDSTVQTSESSRGGIQRSSSSSKTSSDDSSAGQRQRRASSTQRRRSVSRSGKKKKKSKPRTFKVSKNEFKKLNAFLAQQEAEKDDVNTVETDKAEVYSEERNGNSTVIRASAAPAEGTPKAGSKKKKTVRRVPVGSVEHRDDEDDDNQSQGSSSAAAAKSPTWANRKLKTTSKGEMLKKDGVDLAKPISAARPPVLQSATAAAEESPKKKKSSSRESRGATPALSLPFCDFQEDDDDASQFSAPSFQPEWASRKLKPTPKGKLLDQDLAKPISAARPPVVQGEF